MFADEIRRRVDDAPRLALPAVAAALWQAFGEGKVTEAEAETLSRLIEERRQVSAHSGENPVRVVPLADTGLARRHGSRPRTDGSLERRRRWVASGRMPPGIAALFTMGEAAVLAVVAVEVVKHGACSLAVPHLAAVAGVGESTARNAIREARRLGLLTVEERRLTGFRNDTNVVRIISAEWNGWLRLARRSPASGSGIERLPETKGGGFKTVNRTTTGVLLLRESGATEPTKGCRGAVSDPGRSAPVRIRQGGRAGRAMR